MASSNQLDQKPNESETSKSQFDHLKLRDAVNNLDASWAGGEDGTELYEKIIEKAYDLLKENGVFYFLIVQDNCPEVL